MINTNKTMEKLNTFLDKSPLWQSFLLGWVIFTSSTSAMFYGFQFIGATSQNLLISGENCIEIGIILGVFFSLFFTFLLSMIRKSTIFWNYSKELESLIEETNTKDELHSIFNKEYKELINKCQGGCQIFELNRIKSIIQTKYKYI